MTSTSRRDFIRGLGQGAFLLAPIVKGLRAEAAPGAGARFLFNFWPPNGIPTELFKAGKRTSETDFTLPPCFAPLEAVRKDLVFIDSLENKAGREMFVHYIDTQTALTGQPCRDNQPTAGGESIDSYVARLAGFDAPVPRVSITIADGCGAPPGSYDAGGLPLGYHRSPQRLFTSLFDSPALTAHQRQERLRLRKSVLDLVVQDTAKARLAVGKEGAQRLDAYLESVREAERRLVKLDESAARAGACTKPTSPGAVSDAHASADVNGDAMMTLHIDLCVAAFACGLTRVATLRYGCYGAGLSPWLGEFYTRNDQHGLTHDFKIPEVVPIIRWYADRFAYLVTKLRSTPSPRGGSLLDETLAQWVNVAGTNHFMDQCCFVVAGSAGGRVKTGRWLTQPARAHSQNDLYVSLANLMGVPTATFGAKAYCKGPLPGFAT